MIAVLSSWSELTVMWNRAKRIVLAASAVLEMGEGNECVPVVVISGAKNVVFRNRSKKSDQLIVQPEDDIFAPLFWRKGWRKKK